MEKRRKPLIQIRPGFKPPPMNWQPRWRSYFPISKPENRNPVKEAMTKIKDLKLPSEFGTEIADLDRLIKKYKFKDAPPLAEALKTKLQG